MQSKRKSLAESTVNTFSGFIVSLALGYFILPFFGVEKNILVSIEITAIFTVTSVLRNYIVRRAFNRETQTIPK